MSFRFLRRLILKGAGRFLGEEMEEREGEASEVSPALMLLSGEALKERSW